MVYSSSTGREGGRCSRFLIVMMRIMVIRIMMMRMRMIIGVRNKAKQKNSRMVAYIFTITT